jgi:AraC-like DNA-binding protein
LARVVAALANEQLFKDPDLTLDALARHLGLTPNAVSQLLNNGLRQSFSEVVNGYRLAEVKQRLLGPDVQRLTVLAIAFEAGFNSKTTFNRVFKEKTGLTPKEYQKRYHPTHRDDTVPASG